MWRLGAAFMSADLYAFSEHIRVVILRNSAEGPLRPIGGEALLGNYRHRDSETRLERRVQNDSSGVLKPR